MPPFEELVLQEGGRIIFLILDGLGGLPLNGSGGTELEVAHTPHMDELARTSSCGLMTPVGPGITPGSGPSHLALFGYDPFAYQLGRGVLEAAGIDFPLTEPDLAVRVNFATLDAKGRLVDRRAGRLDTEVNRRLCQRLEETVRLEGVELFVRPVKEHRAVVVFRGQGLSDQIEDTDPQRLGVPPLPPKARVPEAVPTVKLVSSFLEQAFKLLRDESPANAILLRGFSKLPHLPPFQERFGLRALALATYPMYRGICRLLGMEVPPVGDRQGQLRLLEERFEEFDFAYFHVKETDSRGEDGDFQAKVRVIEEVDREVLPRVLALNPDVLVITGDHSTPAALRGHSWHPLPLLLRSPWCRPDGLESFGEGQCRMGSLGHLQAMHLMALALAHARRLTKFGA